MTRSTYSNILSTASRVHSGSDSERLDFGQSVLQSIRIDKIQDRITDTRPYQDEQVNDLVTSIKHVGLIEPIVLDRNNQLLCGGRRRMAILRLKELSEEDYKRHFPNDSIPCRIYPIDASQEEEKALEIEIMENAHRRKYTPDEIKHAAQRLLDAGYVNNVGRVQSGKKRLKPTLAELFGVSVRQIDRLLSEPNSETEGQSKEIDTEDETPKKKLQLAYQKIHKKKNWKAIEKSPVLKKKYAQAQKLLDEIAASLDTP